MSHISQSASSPQPGSSEQVESKDVNTSFKRTVPWIRAQKLTPQSSKSSQKESRDAVTTRLSMLTAYDYPTARICDDAGVDIILVGDSLGPVLYGDPNTLSVTMDQMLMHTRAVTRGAQKALVIGDMPFMSYQVNQELALINAGRFLKEAGAHAVKLEGGSEVAPLIAALCKAGIPVCAHIGLTPQSIQSLGTYRMHGKTPIEREYLLQSAKAVAEAGAFCVVLECVEAGLAREITQNISIPTIGIGSGSVCDGEVLVFHDLVGYTIGHVPKFVKPTANVGEIMKRAVADYVRRTQTENLGSLGDVLSH